jgi:hypothetical protein
MVPHPEALGWRSPSAGKSTDAKAQAHGYARAAPTRERRAPRLARTAIVRRARRPRPARAGNFQSATPARNGALQKTTLQSGPRYAAIASDDRALRLSLVPRAPEDSARHTAPAGFFFATSAPRQWDHRPRDNWDGTPSTLGNMGALGVRRLLVSCRDNACGRETLLDISRCPAGTEIPALARRLACDRCGRDVVVRPNWQDIR